MGREAWRVWPTRGACGVGSQVRLVLPVEPPPVLEGVLAAHWVRAAVPPVDRSRLLWPWPLRLLWPTLPRCGGEGQSGQAVWPQQARHPQWPVTGRLVLWRAHPGLRHRVPLLYLGPAGGGCWGVSQRGQWCRALPAHRWVLPRVRAQEKRLLGRLARRLPGLRQRSRHTANPMPACAATSRSNDLLGECDLQALLRGCVS